MNKKIIDILKPLNIPVRYVEYSGDSDCYAIFTIYSETENNFSDDSEGSVVYDLSINLWFKSSKYIDTYKEIKRLMKANGFIFNDVTDLGKDESYYGKNLTFTFVEVV